MLRMLLVGILLGTGLVGALISPFYGLLAYLWFAIFRPQEWVWTDISAFRFSLVLGLMFVGRSLMAGLWPNVSHRLAVGCLAYLLLALVCQANSFNSAVGWFWFDYLARLILVSLFLARIVDSPHKLVWTVGVIAASFGFHTAKAGLAFILSGGVRYYAGLAGAFSDNNGYALGAAMIMPLLAATAQCAFAFPPKVRWITRLFWVAVPLTILMVIGTFSRGGFLAVLAGVFVFVMFHNQRRGIVVAAVGLSVLAATSLALPDGYLDRVRTIQTYDEVGEASALSRLHFWAVATQIAQDHPFGIGLRGFRYVYDSYDTTEGAFGTARSVHSSHFQVLVEVGYIGFLLWMWLFISSFRICLSIRRRARELPDSDLRTCLMATSVALMASMASFLVGGAFIELALNDFTWLTFGLVVALDGIAARAVGPAAGEAPTSPDKVVAVRVRPQVRRHIAVPARGRQT